MKSEPVLPKRGSSGCCTCCKILFALLLTAVCLVPVVFLVGTQENYFYQKPFYSLLEQSQQLKEIRGSINEQLLKSNKEVSVINLYSSDSAASKSQNYMAKEEARRWQNLKESAEYFGYWLNQQRRPTISRSIRYPSENVSSIPKESLKQFTKKAYSMDIPSNPIFYLKKKLTKMIRNIATRLRWKEENNPELVSYIKNYIISLVKKEHTKKTWLVILLQENEEYHHPGTLNKKISEWREEHKDDQLIIVSRLPLDKDNHRIASIEVNVDREVLVKELTQMGDKKEQKLRLPFLVDHPKNVFSYLMNRYEGSLSKISKFIQYCHENHLCQLTYTLLRDYINLKYSIEGQLAVLCSIDENYLNGLSEKDFANDFGSMMQELAVKDKKQFRKDVNLLHNIIRVDICGTAPEQETNKEGGADEAIQKGEKTAAASDKDGTQQKLEKIKKNVKKMRQPRNFEEERQDKKVDSDKDRFAEKVKLAKLKQEEKLRLEAETIEKQEDKQKSVSAQTGEEETPSTPLPKQPLPEQPTDNDDIDRQVPPEEEEAGQSTQPQNENVESLQVVNDPPEITHRGQPIADDHAMQEQPNEESCAKSREDGSECGAIQQEQAETEEPVSIEQQ